MSKCYLEIEKQQKSKGNVERGEGTSIVGSHAGGDGECINDKCRKRKRKTRKRKQKQNGSELGDIHVGENGPASISDRGEAVSMDDTRGYKSCSSGGAGDDSKSSSGIHEGVNGPPSISSNTGEAISIDETRDDKNSSHGGAVADNKCISGKTKKRKRKPKQNVSKVCDISEVENGPASISNKIEAVSLDYTRADKTCSNGGDGACINGEASSGLPEFYSSDDKLASISNLGEITSAGDNGDDYDDGKSTRCKSRRQKRRKRSSGLEVSNVSVGADGPASISNLDETLSLGVSGDCGGESKGISGKSKSRKRKRKRSSGVELPNDSMDANGPVLISNIEQTTYAGDMGVDKHCCSNWPREQVGILDKNRVDESNKPIEGGNEIKLLDSNGISESHGGEHGLTFHLNPKEAVFVNGIGGDEKRHGHLSKSKKQRLRRTISKAKRILDSNVSITDSGALLRKISEVQRILDNNVGITDSGGLQIPESRIFVGVTGGDKMSIDS